MTCALWQPLAEAIGIRSAKAETFDDVLAKHELAGWLLSAAAKMMIGGERDLLVLTDDVDANSGAIIEHILHQVSRSSLRLTLHTQRTPASESQRCVWAHTCPCLGEGGGSGRVAEADSDSSTSSRSSVLALSSASHFSRSFSVLLCTHTHTHIHTRARARTHAQPQ